MPSLHWENLTPLQLGRYAEYYAMMEFASYGFAIFSSEVDDRGVDFIAKREQGQFIEVQVKSVRKGGYTFMLKSKWDIDNSRLYLALVLFTTEMQPNIYLIPASAWSHPDALVCDMDYPGLKSPPEYGVRISKRNQPLLDQYRLERIITLL